MTDPTAAVLDAVRYLQRVRPIDPAEIVQYVEEDRTPAEIAAVIREHAFELKLVERADGTFVPVATDPLYPEPVTVEAIPERYLAVLRTLLCDRYGEEWAIGETGDQLRAAIRACKAAYFAGEPVMYDEETALGYSLYHFPASYATMQYVLSDLDVVGLSSHHLKILEIGAGVGGATVGLIDRLGTDCLVSYRAIEPSEHAVEILRLVVERTHPNVQADIETRPIESTSLDDTYDLIVCSKVLNELEDPVSVMARLAAQLAPDGSLLAIEPADERTSRGLRRIERSAVVRSPLEIYSPTVRLWPDREPTTDDWSFVEQEPIMVPEVQRRLDEAPRDSPDDRDPATGEFVNRSVRYSYSILRTDGTRRIAFEPDRRRWTPLAAVTDRITERVDVAAVKLSDSIASTGNPVYVIGDGSQTVEHFAIHTDATEWNGHLRAANYGDVLLVEDGLALWNDDEEAVNLVVDRTATVHVVTPTASYHADERLER